MERPATFLAYLLVIATSTASQIALSFVIFSLGVLIGVVCILAADRYMNRDGDR
jgi:hypothetical protein